MAPSHRTTSSARDPRFPIAAVYCTFDAPLNDVHAAVRTTLSRLEFPGPEEQVHGERVTLRTNAIERRVRIELE
jgi:hypothetical protein